MVQRGFFCIFAAKNKNQICLRTTIRYDIYRRRFDARQLSFGEPQLVLNASADSLSATLPRISPDGRWIVYQSRRRDDNYTRLYFSYFDREGRAHKPFEMPQADPDYGHTAC